MRFQTVHTPTSLTEGPISQALISFALPLLWATCSSSSITRRIP